MKNRWPSVCDLLHDAQLAPFFDRRGFLLNWDMQIIDGCSIKLCVSCTFSLTQSHRNKLNSELHDSSVMVPLEKYWFDIILLINPGPSYVFNMQHTSYCI